MKRFASPAFFVLAAGCFFLPFLAVSCDPGPFAEEFGGTDEAPIPEGGFEITISGLNLVLNTEPEGTEEFQRAFGDFGESFEDLGGAVQDVPTGQESFPGRVFAILAIGAAAVGLVSSFLRGRIGAVGGLLFGAAGAVFLFLLKSKIDSDLGPAAFVGFEVKYKYGYWLAVGLFVAAGLVGVFRLVTERPRPIAPGPPL